MNIHDSVSFLSLQTEKQLWDSRFDAQSMLIFRIYPPTYGAPSLLPQSMQSIRLLCWAPFPSANRRPNCIRSVLLRLIHIDFIFVIHNDSHMGNPAQFLLQLSELWPIVEFEAAQGWMDRTKKEKECRFLKALRALAILR